MTPEEISDAGLQLDLTGPVATVTLNRPDVRNAQTPLMWRALAAIGESLPSQVRVVVLTGAGPTFSAGLDRAVITGASMTSGTTGEPDSVADLLALSDDAMADAIGVYQHGFTWLRDERFVSIAMVRGYAIGAGLQLALACDLRIVSDDVQFSMRESTLGLVPDLTGTKPLVECVGYARALEMCVTARMVGAAEAVASGLATLAVPGEQLGDTVAELAGALCSPDHDVARETKLLLRGAAERSLDEQRRLEREAQVRRLRRLAAAAGGERGN